MVLNWISQYLFALGAGAITYVVFLVVKHVVRVRKIGKVVDSFPMDAKHWFWGHLHQFPGFSEKGLKYHEERLLRYPRACGFWAGNWIRPTVIFHHPDNVKVILKTAEPKPMKTGSYRFGKEWIGEGLLFSSGDKWHRNRRLLTNVFHFEILKRYLKVKNECTDLFMNRVAEYAKRGESIEMFGNVALLTLDIILKCAFSYEDDIQKRGEDHPYLQAVVELQDLWLKRCLYPWQHFDMIYHLTEDWKKFNKNTNFVHDISEKMIKKRKELHKNSKDGNLQQKDFLDILLSARDEDGVGLSEEQIRNEVDTFMFGGHDTTSSAISWILFAMASYPEHQKLCQEEIDEIFSSRPDGVLQWEDLNKMTYLTMCIKESLRLHTPVHIIERELEHPLVVEGVELPKGLVVSVHIYALHHNPAVWSEPMKFDPDRFSADNFKTMDPYAFIPFSAGPRNCIGQNFAMDEIKVVVAKFLKRFTVELDPNHVTQRRIAIVMKTEDGMYLKVKERNLN